MQPTLCTRCKKRIAVVFISKMEKGESVNEGLCLKCAKEIGLPQVGEMMRRMGITDEDLDMINDEMMSAFGGAESMEGLIPKDEDGGDEDSEDGKTATFPFLNRLFGSSQDTPAPTGESSGRTHETKERKSDKPPKRKYLDSYCINLTERAKTGKLDHLVGREQEIERVIQILNRRQKNNPCLIGEPGVGKTAIAEGLAQKLDTKKLSGWGNINPVYQGQFFDPNNEYTVPYGSGVQTIVYDPARIQKEITGYADLWDPSLKDNLAVIGNYRVINGMALKVMGESYNTEDTAVIQAAGQKLLELAPNIRLIKNDNLQDDLLSGEVGAAVMYTSQVTLAKLQNPDLRVVYPKEGVGFGIIGTFIPSKAPNAEAAYQFIDYILRPEVSAQCFEYMGYYCTNKAADEKINEAYREFLTLPEGITGGEMVQTVSAAAEEAHNKAWTEFRAACGA